MQFFENCFFDKDLEGN